MFCNQSVTVEGQDQVLCDYFPARGPKDCAVDKVNGERVLSYVTLFTRSPGLLSEIRTPFLHQAAFVVPEHRLHAPKVHRTESEVESRSLPGLKCCTVPARAHAGRHR